MAEQAIIAAPVELNGLFVPVGGTP